MVNFEGLTCVMQLHATEHLLSMHGWLVGCNRGHAGCPGRVLGLELWQVACVPRWWLHSTGMIHRSWAVDKSPPQSESCPGIHPPYAGVRLGIGLLKMAIQLVDTNHKGSPTALKPCW